MSLLGTAGWTVCFCGRICTACVDLLNRVFSTYLIGFRLRATKQERKSTLKSLRYYVFQDDQGSVFCKWAEKRCSRWRHSSTLGWCPRVTEIGTKIIIHGLVKQTQFYVSFITPWLRNGTFQRPQSFQFSNRSLFRSSPVVKDLKWRLKEYCQKNKRQRWDICEKFSVWRFVTKSTRLKSVKPGMSSHFSESRDPSYVSLAMCPECPGKDWWSKSFGLQSTLHPRKSGPEFVKGPGGVTTSPTLLGPLLVWSQQDYLRLLLIVRYFGSS